MTIALGPWFRRFFKSLEVPAPEAAHRLERLEIVERRFVLPIKVAALLMLVYSFLTSPWFGTALTTHEVAVETVRAISWTYAAANVLVAVVLLLSRRVPFMLVQWSVFAICLVDAVFLAGVTVLTGGYASVLYWLFVVLIVRNAASIPPAWSQLVLNFCVCLCYLMAGSLAIAITESMPEMYSQLPRSSLLEESEVRNPPSLIEKLRQGSDPVSRYLWQQFSPRTQRVLSDTNSPPELQRTLLVDELNRVLRGSPIDETQRFADAALQVLSDTNASSAQRQARLKEEFTRALRGNSIYDPQRFAGVSLRKRTRIVLEQNPPTGDRLMLLNRLLLEDAYPQEIARGQALHQIVAAEATTEVPTEPLLFRLFVLLLMAACCYGIQVLLEKQRLATEEAHESGLREGQLRLAGRLAAEIAHQIKNPLAIINNAAFSVERALQAGRASPHQQIDIIQEEVERADRIITQLMGYAQLAEGHVERLNVTEELDRALAQIFPPAAGYRTAVERHYAPHLPPLLMQRSHLSEILNNLLQNAREATGGAGRLSVSAHAHPDNAVEIEIRDDGPGIAPDKQARIFEAYYTTKEKGTGLGLAIVKHNVELYAGTVRVESVLGKGARFVLLFPAKTHF